jgi:hypothetical protein
MLRLLGDPKVHYRPNKRQPLDRTHSRSGDGKVAPVLD